MPQFPRDRLINDDYGSIVGNIVPVEIPAFNQAHSHCLQVARRNNVYEHRNVIESITLLLLTLRGNAPTPVPAHRQIVRYSSRLDARNHQTSARDFLPDRGSLRRISAIVIVNTDSGCVACLEAQINVQHAEKAAIPPQPVTHKPEQFPLSRASSASDHVFCTH